MSAPTADDFFEAADEIAKRFTEPEPEGKGISAAWARHKWSLRRDFHNHPVTSAIANGGSTGHGFLPTATVVGSGFAGEQAGQRIGHALSGPVGAVVGGVVGGSAGLAAGAKVVHHHYYG